MEEFDVLDENGEFTGEIVERDKAHSEGMMHRAVVLFLVNSKKQILLQKRSLKKKKWPGYWDVTSGGHVDAGELGLFSAVRELEEELGIKVEPQDVRYICCRRTDTRVAGMIDKHMNEYFVAFKDIDIRDIKMQVGEVEEVNWVDYDVFKTMVTNKESSITPKWAAYEMLIKYLERYGFAENLDYYDADGNFAGTASRAKVHAEGLWHKTAHCWLYDGNGDVFFQLRAENNKMYTTASGHVLAGETVKTAIAREVREELGIDIDTENAELVQMFVWKMDKKKPDGTEVHDRAFSNVYVCKIDTKLPKFNFDKEEVSGLVKINVRKALELLQKESGTVDAIKITTDNKQERVNIEYKDFLVFPHMKGIVEYGTPLEYIKNLSP